MRESLSQLLRLSTAEAETSDTLKSTDTLSSPQKQASRRAA